jgi:chitodextrinase
MKLRLASACAVLAVLLVAVPTASAQRRDRTPPSTPTNLRVTGVTEDSISVAWNASTDNSGRILRYIVYYSGGGSYVSGTTKTITGLVPSFSTEIRVQAVDFSENHSAMSAPVTGTTAPDRTPPTTPGNLRVSATTPSSVSLSWDRSFDRWGLGYQVLVDGEVVGGTVAQAFRVRRLAPGSTHTFAVRARDGAGNLSANSNPLTVTLDASNDRTPPSAPSNLVATTPPGDLCGSNSLTWGASNDNADPASAIEYEIYLNGRLREVTRPGVTHAFLYTDTGTNTWTVVAVDRSGNASAPSNPSTVTVVSDPNQC